jgi:hypothetical protein
MDHGPRRLLAAALAAALAVAVTGCGSDSEASDAHGDHDLHATPSAQVTTAPPSNAKVIGVTITADSVSPSGAQISVKRNQPVVLEIDAAAEGELHVHSSPEQHIEFPAGKSQVQLKLEQPGVVDIEDHALDKLIVQLEVH